MGFFGKIFKSIGKVFTSIGKVIKKAFTAVGKFTNKLGIVGQIGMMFIMPAIGGLAMKGLTTLGSGFMTGLNAAAQGTGALSGVAKVTHGIFSTVAKIASSGMEIFDTITGAVKGTLGNIAKAVGKTLGFSPTESMSTTFSGAANVFDGRPVTADPYAIVGKVATPDPYGILGKGISLDDVYGDIDPSKGLIGAETTPIDMGEISNIREIGRPLSAAEQARADFDVSATAGYEKAVAAGPDYSGLNEQGKNLLGLTTEPLVTGVVPSEPGIVQKALTTATQNLVTSGVRSLFAPSYVEPPVELDYAQHVPGKTSLYERSLAENLARGSGAPLGTLSSSVIGGDWNTMVASNQAFNDEMGKVYQTFLEQSKDPQPYQPLLVS